MPLRVPERVHLMPVGFEEDRIFLTAEQLKADEVVLVVNRDDDEEALRHRNIAIEELEDRGYDPDIVETDIFDLYASLGAFASQIHQYSHEEVYVNISTGSKITAVAGMVAAMMNDVHAYYVKAKEYREDDVPRGVADIIELPRYPIQSPDFQHIQILDHLLENERETLTKSDLIDFADAHNLQFVNRDVGRKAKYRLLDSHVLEPMLNEGYVTISEEGRNRVVEITEKGKDLVSAFRYMLDMPDNQTRLPA